MEGSGGGALEGGGGLFSQGPGASQFDAFNITESQLGTQVDFSFLDFAQSQQDAFGDAYGDLPPASQVGRVGGGGSAQAQPMQPMWQTACCCRRRRAAADAAHLAAPPAPYFPQVPTFQPTQGDAAMGLDAALSQLNFQDALEGEPAAEAEQPAELPEWACA